MKKNIILFLCLLGIVGLTACSNPDEAKSIGAIGGKEPVSDENQEKEATQGNEGPIAPDFVVTDFEGNEYKLSDQLGKKVYIKFWASWCGICLSEMDKTEELFEQDKDFEAITIVSPGMAGEKSKEEFIEWFKKQGHEKIKVYFDETGEVMAQYGIRGFPTAAFIGSDGVVLGTQPGSIPNEVIIDAFKKIK